VGTSFQRHLFALPHRVRGRFVTSILTVAAVVVAGLSPVALSSLGAVSSSPAYAAGLLGNEDPTFTKATTAVGDMRQDSAGYVAITTQANGLQGLVSYNFNGTVKTSPVFSAEGALTSLESSGSGQHVGGKFYDGDTWDNRILTYDRYSGALVDTEYLGSFEVSDMCFVGSSLFVSSRTYPYLTMFDVSAGGISPSSSFSSGQAQYGYNGGAAVRQGPSNAVLCDGSNSSIDAVWVIGDNGMQAITENGVTPYSWFDSAWLQNSRFGGAQIQDAVKDTGGNYFVATNAAPYLSKWNMFSGSFAEDTTFRSNLAANPLDGPATVLALSYPNVLVGGSFTGRVKAFKDDGSANTAFNAGVGSALGTNEVSSFLTMTDASDSQTYAYVGHSSGSTRLLLMERRPSPALAPTAVAGRYLSATVSIAQNASGVAPSSYLITSTPGSKTCTVTGASGSCVISGLTNGTNYTFRAMAYNGTAPALIEGPSSSAITAADNRVNLTVAASQANLLSGETVSPTIAVTSGALISGDALSSATFTYLGISGTTYASSTTAPTNPGTYRVTPSAVVVSPGPASNYVATYSPGTFTIAKASRTLSFASTTANMSYGQMQTMAATPSAGAGDGAITYSAGSSDACTVGASTGVVRITASSGTCEISASIADGTGYFAASTITPLTITVSAMNLQISGGSPWVNYGTTYTPTAIVTSGALAGVETITGATYLFEGTGSTSYGPSATPPTNAGTYSVTPSNATLSHSAANYNITYAPGLLTINRVGRTLSFATTSASLFYGDTTTVVATPSVSDGTVTYSSGASTACSVNSASGLVTIIRSTGTCAVTATIGSAANHASATTTTPVTITVGKRVITVGVAPLSVIRTNAVSPLHTVTVGTLAGSDTISGMTFTYAGTGGTSYSASTTPPTAMGTYSVTPSAASFIVGLASDYTISYAPGTLSIVEKSTRTLSFDVTSLGRSFGDTETLNPTLSAGTGEGTLVYSHGSSTACTVDSPSGLLTITAPTGTCQVSVSVAETPSYLATATTASLSVTVSRRVITVSGDDATVAYGLPLSPSYSVNAGGLLLGDDITDVTYTYAGVGSTAYPASTTAPIDAGTYSVTPSAATGLSNTNYDIQYASGTLTISPPAAPNVIIAIETPIGAPLLGADVRYEASGLRVGTPYTLVIRSTPHTLASGTAALGAASGTVAIPSNLEEGWHSLTFTSTDPLGNPVTEVVYVKLSASGALLEISPTLPSENLAMTGAASVAPYLWLAFGLFIPGAFLVVMAARRRFRRTGTKAHGARG
jgi:hypothetical protein